MDGPVALKPSAIILPCAAAFPQLLLLDAPPCSPLSAPVQRGDDAPQLLHFFRARSQCSWYAKFHQLPQRGERDASHTTHFAAARNWTDRSREFCRGSAVTQNVRSSGHPLFVGRPSGRS